MIESTPEDAVTRQRVLHVVATAQRRGAEMFAADLVRALDALGVEQHVAVLRDVGAEAIAFDAPTERLGADGHRLPGLRIHLGAISRLRSRIRSFQPTVVHAHGGEPYKHALLAVRPFGVPIIYRRIGEVTPVARRGLPRIAHGGLMRRSDRIVAVAEAVRDETIEMFGVNPERVITIPRGIDPDRLVPTRAREETRAELGIPADALVLTSLGALSWEKDPLTHLEVTARLVGAHARLVHLFAGEGPMRAELEKEIRRRNLGERVLVLGSRTDVAELLAASDVILLASRQEGMPGCLIEAGMVGVPAAAYRVAGVGEVIVDGKTGLLIPPGDLDRLVAEVGRLISDPELRTRLGRAARDRCIALFDIHAIAARYLAVYEELC
jgi:glycosyltransferase involved in cell wall biosynthesis